MAVQISCQFHPLVHSIGKLVDMWRQQLGLFHLLPTTAPVPTFATTSDFVLAYAMPCSTAALLMSWSKEKLAVPSIDIDAQCFSQANLLCLVLKCFKPWYQAIKTCLKPPTHHTWSYQDFNESHWAPWAPLGPLGIPMLALQGVPIGWPVAGFAGALACCRKGNPAKTSASW